MRHLLALRFVFAALAIAALQAWLPVSAYARVAGPNGLTIEICTPQGLKRLTPDTNGSPIESPAGTSVDHADHCPLCATSPAPPESPASAGMTSAFSGEKPASDLPGPAPTSQAPLPPATGPPHLS